MTDITVRATNSGGYDEQVLSLTIRPTAPSWIFPTNSLTIYFDAPYAEASAIAGADSYIFQVSADNFSSVIEEGTPATPAFQFASLAAHAGALKFRVASVDGGVQSPWTTIDVTLASNFLTTQLLATFGSGTISNTTADLAVDTGTIRYISANSVCSITGGKLYINGSPITSVQFVSGDGAGADLSYAHTRGRFFRLKIGDRTTLTSAVEFMRFGVDQTGSVGNFPTLCIDYGAGLNIPRSVAYISAAGGTIFRNSIDLGAGDHLLAIVMLGTGAFWLVRGASGRAEILWVDRLTTAAFYASLRPSGTYDAKFDDYMVKDHSGLSDDYQFNLVHQAPPGNGTIYSAKSDGLIFVNAGSAPASPTGGMIAYEIRYRYVDASNYWTIKVARNSGNTAWNLNIYSRTNGSETLEKQALGVGWNTRYGFYVRGTLSRHARFDPNNPITIGSDLVSSAVPSGTGLQVVWDASTSITDLEFIPLTNDMFDSIMAA